MSALVWVLGAAVSLLIVATWSLWFAWRDTVDEAERQRTRAARWQASFCREQDRANALGEKLLLADATEGSLKVAEARATVAEIERDLLLTPAGKKKLEAFRAEAERTSRYALAKDAAKPTGSATWQAEVAAMRRALRGTS